MYGANGGDHDADYFPVVSYAAAEATAASAYAEVGAWAVYDASAEGWSTIWRTVQVVQSGTFYLHAGGTASWYLSALSLGLTVASAEAHFYFRVYDTYTGEILTYSFLADRGATWNEVDNGEMSWGATLSFYGTAGHQYQLQAYVWATAYVITAIEGGGTAVADCAGPTLNIENNFGGYQGIILDYVDFYVPSSGGCVAEGTLITMADGSHLPVEQLTKGSQVLGYDVVLGTLEVETVKIIESSIETSLLDINDGALRLTLLNQPIYARNGTEAGWVVDPIDLEIGWYLFNPVLGQWIQITSLEVIDGFFCVYDVGTTNPDTFIADGFLLDLKRK